MLLSVPSALVARARVRWGRGARPERWIGVVTRVVQEQRLQQQQRVSDSFTLAHPSIALHHTTTEAAAWTGGTSRPSSPTLSTPSCPPSPFTCSNSLSRLSSHLAIQTPIVARLCPPLVGVVAAQVPAALRTYAALDHRRSPYPEEQATAACAWRLLHTLEHRHAAQRRIARMHADTGKMIYRLSCA